MSTPAEASTRRAPNQETGTPPRDQVHRVGAVAVRFLEADGPASDGDGRDGTGTPRPVVVLSPAMGTPAGYYTPFAGELRRRGLHVVLMDLRGQGDSTPAPSRASRYGYRELVGEDLPAVVAAARERFPGSPLILAGHSLGGHLTCLYAASGDTGIDGIVLIATASPYFRCFGSGALRILVASQAMSAITRVVGYWPGDRLRFGGRQARGVIRDWARLARTGRYRMEGITDAEAALTAVTTPTLAVTIDRDGLAPRAAAAHVTGKMTAAPVTWWHYTAETAGVDRLDHFRWIRAGGPLADRIAAWVGAVPA